MFLLKSFKKYFTAIMILLLATPVWAAGSPADNPLYNLAILLICAMIVLLIAIAILGTVLTGAGDVSLMKRKKNKEAGTKTPVRQATAIFIGCMILTPVVFAQDGQLNNNVKPVATIGGLSLTTFYVMISVIFLELLIMLALLINIRLLSRSQKQKLTVQEAIVARKQKTSWWNRLNKFKPIEQEEDINPGHDYAGIRELSNRIPPWWIYGFCITIVFAGIYLWRDHVKDTASLSKVHELAVKNADQKVEDYVKQKGEAIDENSVTLLGAADITEGKRIFQISCVSCHNEGGSGNVGPNLTDDYWIHGGDIKSVFKTIKYGINAMPTWQNSYSNMQIAQLASYVKSIRGTNPPNAKTPQGQLYKDETSAPKSITDTIAAKKDKIAAR